MGDSKVELIDIRDEVVGVGGVLYGGEVVGGVGVVEMNGCRVFVDGWGIMV